MRSVAIIESREFSLCQKPNFEFTSVYPPSCGSWAQRETEIYSCMAILGDEESPICYFCTMILKTAIQILLTASTLLLSAEEPIGSPSLLSFETLKKKAIHLPRGQQVKIRGFLYETPDNKWILAPIPQLKSCCLDSLQQQIIVSGNFKKPIPTHAVTLSGIFNPSSSEGIFYLENAELEKEERPSLLKVLLLLGVIGVSLFQLKRVRS